MQCEGCGAEVKGDYIECGYCGRIMSLIGKYVFGDGSQAMEYLTWESKEKMQIDETIPGRICITQS